MATPTTPTVKYVIVERKNLSGRYVAVRGLSFETAEAAQAHIDTKFNERFRKRFSVESRKVEADDTSERMTCQCCGRKFLARMGSVTHHGYERPGYGYQTASCLGAKKLPFENDHKLCDRLIANLAKHLVDLRKDLKATKADAIPVVLMVEDFSKPRDRMGRHATKRVEVTPETFAQVKAENEQAFRRNSLYDYETAKQKQIGQLERSIKNTAEHKADREAFRATWKHTHNYSKTAKEWVPV